MADNNPDQIEVNSKPNDVQRQIEHEPNPKPLEELSSADLLNKIRDDYRIVKKSIKRSILVLNDKTKGLMVRDFTTKVGDKIIGNEKLIDPERLCGKLKGLDELLDTSLDYIGWLLLHIGQLEEVKKIISENVNENLLETDQNKIAHFENITRNISTKAAVVIPAVGWVVGGAGGVGVCVALTGTALGIHTGLISIVAILASIGICGIAACGVGTVAAGCLAGVTVATGVGAAIWLNRAYQIGKARRGKFEEFVEMERDLGNKDVLIKVETVRDEFRRLVKLIKDIVIKDYNIDAIVREDEKQRDKAVEQYKEVYQEILHDPNIQELSEEKKIKIAERAAKKACKTALENDLVYSNVENFEIFLRERILQT